MDDYWIYEEDVDYQYWLCRYAGYQGDFDEDYPLDDGDGDPDFSFLF